MAKDAVYTGEKTKVFMVDAVIDVAVDEVQNHFGVECVHKVQKGKEKDGSDDVHYLEGSVPKQLAEEMFAAKRARKDLPK